MLTAERRISAQDNQIRNRQALVEATNASISQRIQGIESHERKTVEVEGCVNLYSERLSTLEDRHAMMISMSNELTSKITSSFNEVSSR